MLDSLILLSGYAVLVGSSPAFVGQSGLGYAWLMGWWLQECRARAFKLKKLYSFMNYGFKELDVEE
jgi:hypothetical protein